MRRSLLLLVPLWALSGLGPASAQDQQDPPRADPKAKPGTVLQPKDLGLKDKGDQADPKVVREKVYAAGEVFARLGEPGEDANTFKVQVLYRVVFVNPDAANRLVALRRELVGALQIEDVNERVAELQRIQTDLLAAQAELYTFEDRQLDAELKVTDDFQVRTLQPPVAFDEKGNIRRYTPKELHELRGPGNRPGFKGERDDLRPGQILLLTLVRKPGSATPLVWQAVILAEPAE
jgi:hypothetical protein